MSAIFRFKQNQSSPVYCGGLEEATLEGKPGRQGIICDMWDNCFTLTAERLDEVNVLKNVQDEADTRMLFHTKHAAANYVSIIQLSQMTQTC